MVVASTDKAARLIAPCERCGSSAFVDVPIHNGNSYRRDCGMCGTTLGFPVWHAATAGEVQA